MAAERVIVVTQCSEGAESMGQVAIVGVIQGYRPGSAVKAGSWENAVGEVVCEVGVFFKEFPQGLGKILVKLRGKCRKCTCIQKALARLKAQAGKAILD